ncbi:hypothetical protein LIER_22776 [Lithospermum erythrorhizon]|uniref:Uncharacterized protein n=1 Tax=Lithospermum erythrorhizon TaxID=34254 RepID=A0AAV3QV19_LITER
MYKSWSKLLKSASSASASTWRRSNAVDCNYPAALTAQIGASSPQISSTASNHAFKGILTSVPKPGGGEFGKLYRSPALNDPRIADKLPYSVRTLHQSAIRNSNVKREDAEKIIKDTVASSGRGGGSGWVAKGLKNLNPFWHIEAGIKEILMDYVHHEITLNVILVCLRLFTIIVTKDVFLALVFP